MQREILAQQPAAAGGLTCRRAQILGCSAEPLHKRINAHSAQSRPTPARFQHLLGREKGVHGEFTLMAGLARESAVHARC